MTEQQTAVRWGLRAKLAQFLWPALDPDNRWQDSMTKYDSGTVMDLVAGALCLHDLRPTAFVEINFYPGQYGGAVYGRREEEKKAGYVGDHNSLRLALYHLAVAMGMNESGMSPLRHFLLTLLPMYRSNPAAWKVPEEIWDKLPASRAASLARYR